MATDVAGRRGGAVESKGLKGGALGLMSATVVGVASTAPGYSLAATLGFIAFYVGAVAGDHVDRVHPDGVHRVGVLLPEPRRSRLRHQLQLGDPRDRAAQRMDGRLEQRGRRPRDHAEPRGDRRGVHVPAVRVEHAGDSNWATLALGIAFIMGMTWICVVGIELSARSQMLLLVTEFAILVLFAVVALIKVYGGDIAGSVTPRRRGSNRRASAESRTSRRASCSRCSSTGVGTPR